MNCFLATTNWLASVLAAVCLALALVAVPVGSVKADDPSPTPGEVEIGGNCVTLQPPELVLADSSGIW